MDTQIKSRAWIGHLMVLATTLIYSFNTNFMKIIMPEWIGPEGLVLLRCVICTIVFWIAGLFVHPQSSPQPSRKELLMIMAGGVLGMAGNLLVYLRGLSMTGPVDAFVIRTVQPIIVIILAVIFLHAVFTRYKAIGILLGLAGTLYASLIPHAGVVKDSFAGNMLIFISAIFTSLFLVLIKPYTQKFNPIIVMKWMSLAAFVVTIPFGLKQVVYAPLFFGEPAIHIWLELGYTLIFATIIAYFLNIKALSYISAFTESVYIYLLPVTGATVSIFMGLQKFSWHDPIALVLIITGFIFINKNPKKGNTIPSEIPGKSVSSSPTLM